MLFNFLVMQTADRALWAGIELKKKLRPGM